MSKSINQGYTDTAIEGVTTLSFSRGLLNFGADFRIKSSNPGKEVVMTNITCPTDRPEKIRVAYSEITNIYSGTDVEPSLAAPSKKGVSVLVQDTEVISVSDTTDPSFRIDLPVSYHMVIKVPSSEYITSDVVQVGVGRLISALFDTGSTSGTRIDSLLRGSLAPADL